MLIKSWNYGVYGVGLRWTFMSLALWASTKTPSKTDSYGGLSHGNHRYLDKKKTCIDVEIKRILRLRGIKKMLKYRRGLSCGITF